MLSDVMQQSGFETYEYEWWHFSGMKEVDSAMDVLITDDFRGVTE